MSEAIKKSLPMGVGGYPPKEKMRQAVFLDRDGVIIENRPDHVKNWAEVDFLEGAMSALRRLSQTPWAVVVVSNQGAVGRGLLDETTMRELQQRIVAEVTQHGGRIDASYLCPHHPDDGCDCRKPSPGMLRQAAREHQLDLRHSWLVGDAVTDLQAAQAAGVRGIMVRTGRGTQQESLLPPDANWLVVDNLEAAVEYILENKENSSK
jgi:D-glycero-D-manno-heptose 1,7-bisphosphate phosphatase